MAVSKTNLWTHRSGSALPNPKMPPTSKETSTKRGHGMDLWDPMGPKGVLSPSKNSGGLKQLSSSPLVPALCHAFAMVSLCPAVRPAEEFREAVEEVGPRETSWQASFFCRNP